MGFYAPIWAVAERGLVGRPATPYRALVAWCWSSLLSRRAEGESVQGKGRGMQWNSSRRRAAVVAAAEGDNYRGCLRRAPHPGAATRTPPPGQLMWLAGARQRWPT